MNESKSYIFKFWWLILIILLIPIIVWGLTLIQTPYIPKGYLVDEHDWLSFFGGYLGSCITVLITLYILRITTNQNNKNLRDTLQMSINTARYSDANNEIATIKRVLDNNYRLLDYHRFSEALLYIKNGNYNYSRQLLLEISRDIEMATSSSDIYLKAYKENRTVVEQQYFDVFENVIKDFGLMVNDFNFITSIPEFLSTHQSADVFYTYVNNVYENLKTLSSLFGKVKSAYKTDENFFTLFSEKPKRESINDILIDVYDVITQRLKSMVNEHSSKIVLLTVTQELIKYKEAEADKILTDKLDN